MPYGPENRRVRHRGYGLFSDAVAVAGSTVALAAVSQDGAVGRVMTSDDGITWTLRNTALRTYTCIAYSPALNLWVALPSSQAFILTSTDGITWTESAGLSQQFTSIAWSPVAGRFAAVGNIGNGAWSADGFTWNASAVPPPGGSRSKVSWASGLGLFIAPNAADCAVSADGNTWSISGAIPAGCNSVSAAWSPSLNLLCASGNNVFGSEQSATSPDAITWTSRPDGSGNGWPDIAWSDSLGLFVQCGGTLGAAIMTTPDGINYTTRATPANAQAASIVWSPSLGLFVTVANGGVDRIMTSPDGINWTVRAQPAAQIWRDVDASR